MKWLIVLLFTSSFSAFAERGTFSAEREMRPFKTDGCTMAPEGTVNRPNLFRPCCIAHDLRFWGGGTEGQRDQADRDLRSCIKKLGGPGWAAIFYNAVRLGRLSPWSIESKRWGNAWFELDGYRTLSEEELNRLIEAVRMLDLPVEMKQTYVTELEARLPAVTETNP